MAPAARGHRYRAVDRMGRTRRPSSDPFAIIIGAVITAKAISARLQAVGRVSPFPDITPEAPDSS